MEKRTVQNFLTAKNSIKKIRREWTLNEALIPDNVRTSLPFRWTKIMGNRKLLKAYNVTVVFIGDRPINIYICRPKTAWRPIFQIPERKLYLPFIIWNIENRHESQRRRGTDDISSSLRVTKRLQLFFFFFNLRKREKKTAEVPKISQIFLAFVLSFKIILLLFVASFVFPE